MKVKDNIDNITEIVAREIMEHCWTWLVRVTARIEDMDWIDYRNRLATHEEFEEIFEQWQIPPEKFWDMVK